MHASSFLPTRASVLSAGLALLGLLAGVPVDGWHQPATDASISLDPGSGPPGTKVTVIGSGFPSQAKGAITWGSQSGSVLAEFTANPNGAFSTTFKVPSNASGGVKVWACTVPKLLIAAPICASRSFKVTAAEEPEATQAPVTPLLPTPVRTACDVRRIAGEVVVDFERFSEGENLRGVTLPEGVRFVGDIDLRAFSPVIATHSGSKAMRTDYAGDFGSGGAAVRLSFINLQDFVGMYVGLNERLWSTAPITAVLTAYALDASGSSVVAGMDSVSFGPAATPIRQCLSVSAPGIYEVTLTYGSAGEPEVLDDLIFRGPATPVPQPEDNQPPRVTLLMPEDGAILSNPSIRLQGEVRDDRELAELEYRVNLGDVHPLTFTPAGITPEGDHLYLFAVEPVPVDELRTCGDNLIDVVGRDTAGNTGMDAAGFQLYFGDLELEAAEAVQVVYGADLVREKGTAFRVRVGSTFDCPIQTRFLLELPEDQWSTAPVVSGGDHVALPPSWEYPDTWGLVTIPARARHFTVMLPYVPEGQETNGFGGATPAGLVHNLDGINPDVRVLPRPVAHPVRFGVAIDPGNSWPETDETNNRFDSGPYRVVTTRPYHFIAYQIHGGEGNAGCTAPMAEVEAAFHRSLEFVLATFPIADGKIGGEVDPFEQTWDFSTEDRCAFLARISRMTKENEGDFGVAMTCRGGGAECGDAVFVGAQRTQAETLAHEFNHVVVPMDDVYSKDCYCQWGERYCELPGDDKFYCCYDFSAKGHDYNQMRVTEEAMGVDPHQGCAVDCGQTEGDSCLDASGSDLCEAACDDAGGILRGCPDTLPTAERLLVASDGFWPNRWTPEEGKMYFMDGPSGDNWMIRESMQALGQPSCWDADGVGRNGFIDLLESDRFRYELDPAVLLVSGSVTRAGEVALDPFLILPEGFIDLRPGADGDYRFVLMDGQGSVLSQTGFDLTFWRPDADPGPMNESQFVFRLEWVEGTKAIELRTGDGSVLARREVSAHAPQVEILAPAEGKITAPSTVPIRWRAGDADGDRLSYSLAVSGDGGETWQPVATLLETTSHRVPVSGFKEGEAYIVRVLASDGINTGVAVSPASFEVNAGIPASWSYAALAGLAVLGAAATGLLAVGLWRIGGSSKMRSGR